MAVAMVKGGPLAPNIKGRVIFKEVPGGTEVCAEIRGLPPYCPGKDGQPPIGPHGFHIHDHGDCQVGDPCDPFKASGGHWNPTKQPHGNHPGDFPVLFSNHGKAYMTFFTDKFCVQDVIGKSVIIHQNPDDYRSQPAGASGKRLACGVIEPLEPPCECGG
ncbi:MAG: superoxide dismutase family protein [Negativicutes bacterium]|nr:superoxide dismutase family protein [Negativicutes bacterium]MDR3589897.1 superoxide dismutase family protein [Negativicutes bacterium]